MSGGYRTVDVRLPDGDGSVCRELRARMPQSACPMLTSFDDDALPDAVTAGATGHVLKQIKGRDLVPGVRTVASGQSMPAPATTARLMRTPRGDDAGQESDPRTAALSPREREILALFGEGLTNRQIGQRLFLAEKTVKNHISRLLAELGVERRVQAAVLATQSPADAAPRPHRRPGER